VSSEIEFVTIGGPAVGVDGLSNYIAKLVVEGVTAPLTAGANNDDSTFGGVSFDEIQHLSALVQTQISRDHGGMFVGNLDFQMRKYGKGKRGAASQKLFYSCSTSA
jgi:hypothetical protein